MKAFENYFFVPRWPVFYEDNHLLALYKPSGLLIQGDRTEDITLLDMAKSWIKQRYNKPGNVYLAPVHRLDRPVAGVVLFARTSKAAARLAACFREGAAEKKYLAVVEGVVLKKHAKLANYMERRGPTSRIVDAPTGRSRQASLSYRVLDTGSNKSLLEIDLETGRHHQIRLQLSHAGHPVAGDLRYGASAPFRHRQLALFARSLRIEHPTLKKPLEFVSPLPAGWPWPGSRGGRDCPAWNWQELYADLKNERSFSFC